MGRAAAWSAMALRRPRTVERTPPPACCVQVGSVVLIAAMVNRTFTSSMEVGVRVEEEDVRTGARHHCCRCGFCAAGRGGAACRCMHGMLDLGAVPSSREMWGWLAACQQAGSPLRA